MSLTFSTIRAISGLENQLYKCSAKMLKAKSLLSGSGDLVDVVSDTLDDVRRQLNDQAAMLVMIRDALLLNPRDADAAVAELRDFEAAEEASNG